MQWIPLQADTLWPLQPPPARRRSERHNRLDPYAVWGAATDFRGFTANRQFSAGLGVVEVSILGRLKPRASLQGLRRRLGLFVPYAYLDDAPRSTRHFTARLPLRDLWKLRLDPALEAWELGLPLVTALDADGVLSDQMLLGPPTRSAALAAGDVDGDPPPPPPDDRPLHAVMGVIDYGCAFLNGQFRAAADRSRVVRLWDQQERAHGALQAFWGRSPRFGYGRLRNAGAAPVGDERQAYARLGYLRDRADPRRAVKREVHGTHVLHVAAGRDDPWTGRSDGPASRADIHFVQLPVETVADSSGGSLQVHLLDGVRDILQRAGDDAKVMVVISQGTHAGPHDGSSLIEKALDELLEQRKQDFAIVIGAGNARATADGISLGGHARLELAPGRPPKTLHLLLPEGDETDTFVEIWYPRGASSHLLVKLLPPDSGPDSGKRPSGEAWALVDGPHVIAALVHEQVVPNGDKALALLAFAPTRAGPSGARAPAGLWRIELSCEGKQELPVDAWVERDDPLRGSQRLWPRFVGPHLDPRGTLNALATGRHTLAVGAMLRGGRRASVYSSLAGRGPHERQVDAWAAADDSPAQPGVRATGVTSGSVSRMGGTSVAAPTLARRLYDLMLARKKPVGRRGWAALIRKAARAEPDLVRVDEPPG